MSDHAARRERDSKRLVQVVGALITLAGVTMGLYQIRDGVDRLWVAPQSWWTADILLSLLLLIVAGALALLVGVRASFGPFVLGALALLAGVGTGVTVAVVRGGGSRVQASVAPAAPSRSASLETSARLPALRASALIPSLVPLPVRRTASVPGRSPASVPSRRPSSPSRWVPPAAPSSHSPD